MTGTLFIPPERWTAKSTPWDFNSQSKDKRNAPNILPDIKSFLRTQDIQLSEGKR